MTVLPILYTYSSLMNRVFESAPLDATYWVLVLAVAVIAYAAVGFERWIRRRRDQQDVDL